MGIGFNGLVDVWYGWGIVENGVTSTTSTRSFGVWDMVWWILSNYV